MVCMCDIVHVTLSSPTLVLLYTVMLQYILCVRILCIFVKFWLIQVLCDLTIAILGCAFHNLSPSPSYYKG